MSLLTGVLPKCKSRENGLVGEGYKPSFAGVFTLLRPGTGALRTDGGWRSRRPHGGVAVSKPLGWVEGWRPYRPGKFFWGRYLGLRSQCSLRPRLKYCGPLALGQAGGGSPPQPAGGDGAGAARPAVAFPNLCKLETQI